MIPDFATVEEVLWKRVTPMLVAHGGGIKLKSISPEGEVRVAFEGACTNCPLLGDTLSNSVEASLLEAFPGAPLKVLVVNDIDDDLWNLAKNILQKPRKTDNDRLKTPVQGEQNQ